MSNILGLKRSYFDKNKKMTTADLELRYEPPQLYAICIIIYIYINIVIITLASPMVNACAIPHLSQVLVTIVTIQIHFNYS